MKCIVKLIPILVVFAILILPSTYAQQFEKTTNVFIFAQTQVRNSDGHLVAYLEASRIYIQDMEKLTKLLDSEPVVQTFSRGGQNFELKQLDVENKISEPNVISKTALGIVDAGEQKVVIYSNHDGYPIVPGDTVTTIWTIVRPAH